MRLFYVSLVSAGSVLLPLLASLARWERLRHQYLPLLILFITGFLNESISIYSVYAHASNSLNSNCYILIEHLLICWVFTSFSKSLPTYIIHGMIISGLLVWLADNFMLNTLQQNNSIFRVFSSLCVVYLSVDVICHYLIFRHNGNQQFHELLIAVGLLIFHAYKTFVEAFHIFPLSIQTKGFYTMLWSILSIINIGSNILFTIAILCLPRKRNYIIHW